MTEPKLKTNFLILLFTTITVANLLAGLNLAGFDQSAAIVGA